MSTNPPNPTTNQNRTEPVDGFIQSVRKRINRHRMMTIGWWAAAIGSATILMIAIAYVWPGYRVPIYWYGIVAGLAVLAGLIVWATRRASEDHAAHYADEFYGLKDSVRSCSNFASAGLEGDFYQLQSEQTEELVNQSSLEKIRYQPPYRLATLAIIMAMIAIALGFKGPSDAVVQAEAEAAETVALTSEINEEFRDLIDELDSSLDDEEERKLVNPEKLRQWVEELEETKDRKEAMRQYAKLERKIQKASEALQQKKDERLLDRAAEELKKDEQARELAELLEQKKYKKAGDELQEMQPDKAEWDQKKLSEKRKELAKLKAAARRMADAARNNAGKRKNGNKNAEGNVSKDGDDGNQGENSDAEMGEGEAGEQGELADMLEGLDDAMEALDDQLEEMELADWEEGDEQDLEWLEECEECEECEDGVGDELDELAKKLARMAKKRAAVRKLQSLRKKCAQCQGGLAKGKGGKKAGKGTDETMREERDEKIDNGQYTKLKGLKGKGPSLTKVESADDGTGISGRTAKAKKRDFKRQFESFVEREDVPEDLKSGVKNYFTNIHENSSEPAGEPSEPVEEK